MREEKQAPSLPRGGQGRGGLGLVKDLRYREMQGMLCGSGEVVGEEAR